MENNTEFNEKLSIILQNEIIKAVVSNPTANAKFRKIEIENKHDHFLISAYTEKQVFHQNIAPNNLEKALVEFAQNYKQFNFFGAEYEYMLKISKKNKVFYSKTANKSQKIAINSQNNRQKNYILPEGTVIAPLVDMGIFTPQGKIIASMYDKFKQINRFIEIIDDSLKNQELEHLNIIDFGCGKSYLTFIIYYYFTEIKKIDVNIIGLDLKTDVIENCNKTALKYGYKNLHFEQGDIAGFDAKMPIDMVITLHACDTATD